METIQANSKLRTAVKLRHLVESINANWGQMGDVDKRVKNTLSDAKDFINSHGDEKAQAHFNSEMNAMQKHIDGVGQMLSQASNKLKNNERLDPAMNWTHLHDHLAKMRTSFAEIADYGKNHMAEADKKDWNDIWQLIGSELKAVQGLSESAYMKAHMIAEMSKDELTDLTRTIVKHIPQHFSLTEAEEYETEYLEAMDQIKQETNSTNLWDKFLNVLAGMVPFEQSPAERVMMQRWVEGEQETLSD